MQRAQKTLRRALAALPGLVAALPERVAYALATPAYWLLYHVFRYRRRTVRENLAQAFPDAGAGERKRIETAFYRHLCNLCVEILRSTRMTRTELAERARLVNLEVMAEATENFEKQAIILLIHQGNWEWMLHGAMAQMPVPVDPVYKALHSPFWDDYMLRARSRFGAVPMRIDRVGREVLRGRKRKRAIAMLADQAGPQHGGYWTEFLGRPASFHRGPGKLALALDLPVLFAQCRRLRRGYYDIEFHPVSLPHQPRDAEQILKTYVRLTQAMIVKQPETYLWSNRRWKRTPPEEYTAVSERQAGRSGDADPADSAEATRASSSRPG